MTARLRRSALFLLSLSLFLLPASSEATDRDGPNDCLRTPVDLGDAPEGILAYPATIGRFPTCVASGVPVGLVQGPCPPIFAVPPPGATAGWVRHAATGNGNFWLACVNFDSDPYGIDGEFEGKVNTPATGFSACAAAQTTDCVENAFGMTFDQDECLSDGSDASLFFPNLTGCLRGSLVFSTTNCGPAKHVFLNVLLDMNGDGDWLDSFDGCDAYGTAGCIHEWAVVNAPIALATDGCEGQVSPMFPVGNSGGPGWLRLSLSPDPAPPDFPWAGSASLPGGQFAGGETEDYPIQITSPPLPVRRTSWGQTKLLYR